MNNTVVEIGFGHNSYLQFQLAFKQPNDNTNYYYPFNLHVFPYHRHSIPEIYLVPNKRI